MLAQSVFTLEDYLHATAGKPDPDEIISCVKRLIDGPINSDLKAVGPLGGRSAYSIYESLARMGFGYDVDDVQGMILRYNMTFSGIDAWGNEVVSSALEDGVISTLSGRQLKVIKDTNVNSLINYPVQGTAADGFKNALIRLDEELNDQDVEIIHILHDEVIVEAREDIAEAVASIVKNCMEQAFEEMLPGVPMIVKPLIQDSWGEAA
jgi:DNA polymerase I